MNVPLSDAYDALYIGVRYEIMEGVAERLYGVVR
jgi:hypothetical protein